MIVAAGAVTATVILGLLLPPDPKPTRFHFGPRLTCAQTSRMFVASIDCRR